MQSESWHPYWNVSKAETEMQESLEIENFCVLSPVGMRLRPRNYAYTFPYYGKIPKSRATQSEVICYFGFPQCPSLFTTSQFCTRL